MEYFRIGLIIIVLIIAFESPAVIGQEKELTTKQLKQQNAILQQKLQFETLRRKVLEFEKQVAQLINTQNNLLKFGAWIAMQPIGTSTIADSLLNPNHIFVKYMEQVNAANAAGSDSTVVASTDK